MTTRPTCPHELQQANDAVLAALQYALTLAIDGTGSDDTDAPAVTAAIILLHDDGIAQTSVVGLPNKVSLYGALVDCILSIHEVDKVNKIDEIIAARMAQMEKWNSSERTDN
jgi:hypothetical protein